MLKKEDVLHVAKLARLRLSDSEVDKFSKQLSAVFDSFEEIDKVELKGIPETSQVTGLKNISRVDEAKKIENLTDSSQGELFKNVPIHDGGKIIVPKVIDSK